MAILFVGSAGDEFPIASGAPGTHTNPIYHDATYARSTVFIAQETIGADFAAQTDVWLAFTMYANVRTNAGEVPAELRAADDTSLLRLRVTTQSTDAVLEYWNGASWVSAGTVLLTSSTLERVAIRLKKAVAGRVEVYRDGVLEHGTDVDTSGLPDIAQFRLNDANNNAAYDTYYSEVICASHNIGSARLAAIAVTGAGAQSGWSGAYTDVDNALVDDATFIASGTAGQKSSFIAEDLPAGSLTVSEVSVVARVRRGGTGPQNANALLRVGGTDYTQSLGTVGESFAKERVVWTLNPATSGAWDAAAVNALEIGVESVA